MMMDLRICSKPVTGKAHECCAVPTCKGPTGAISAKQGVITSLGREFPVEAVGLEACRDDQGSRGY